MIYVRVYVKLLNRLLVLEHSNFCRIYCSTNKLVMHNLVARKMFASRIFQKRHLFYKKQCLSHYYKENYSVFKYWCLCGSRATGCASPKQFTNFFNHFFCQIFCCKMKTTYLCNI